MSTKQKESLSKRQARREELRRKERQQRIIIVGAVAVIGLAILGFIIVPSVRTAMNPGGDFIKITPVAYKAAIQGTNMGDPNAKVKMDVFEDFQCSACKSYVEGVEPDVIRQLVEPGTVYYVFHQLPFLDDNLTEKDSDRAANASECAAEQNRFWDYHAILFANQHEGLAGNFSDERLRAFAKSLGLDMTQFDACYSTNRYQNQIQQDIALSNEMGVTGTPSVFINGKMISPGKVPTINDILQAVQAALAGN
jgi:protein-disulfide isomerase